MVKLSKINNETVWHADLSIGHGQICFSVYPNIRTKKTQGKRKRAPWCLGLSSDTYLGISHLQSCDTLQVSAVNRSCCWISSSYASLRCFVIARPHLNTAFLTLVLWKNDTTSLTLTSVDRHRQNY